MKSKKLDIVFAAVLIAILLSVPAKSFGSSVLNNHAPIFIGNNSSFTPANGVTSGSGTAGDPFIIENWTISAASADGIAISGTTKYFTIRNCLIENGGSSHNGIYFYNVINGTIENNICDNNYEGIDFGTSANYNILDNNTCMNNLDCGIHLYHASNNTITNNTCSYDSPSSFTWTQAYDDWSGGIDIFGIALSYSDNNILDNNICMNNVSCGIHLDSSSYNTITRNTGSSNFYGISRNGIALYSSRYNILDNNTFDRGSHTGIKLSDSSYDNFTNNICENNYNGVYFEYTSSYDNIISNICKNGKYGICLDYSTNQHNFIYNNTCENNYQYGIVSFGATNNTLYLNYLLNNNAHDDGINYWDNGSAGNYWSDWQPPRHVDADNNGVVGTPRSIEGGTNVDHYPLVLGYVPPLKATPVITWSNPANITYDTALSSTQLNASANVTGSFAYTPAAGTVLSAGSHTLSVTFTPTDATDYNTATASVTITVNKVTLTVTGITANSKIYNGNNTATLNFASATLQGVVSGDDVRLNTSSYTATFASKYVGTGISVTVSLGLSSAQAGDYSLTQPTGLTANITPATPSFSGLSSLSITYGTASTSLGGTITAGSLIPTGSVSITLNGVTQTAPIDATTGAFSFSFDTSALGVAGSPYTISYSYAATTNFNGASGSGTLTVVAASDFTMSVSPTSGSVNQGVSASTTVSLTSVSGFSSTVSLTTSGMPSGATATFTPSSGAPSFTSTLTISTALTTPAGAYTITITGTGGGKTHSTTFSLTITAASPDPDFTMSVSPTSGSVNQGVSASTTVSLTSVSGFSSTVSLTTSGMPSGATATFTPSSGAPSFTSTLTISTALTTPAGAYTITITGTGGGKTHSTTFSLTVTAAPPENTALTGITVQVENTAENVKITVQEVTEGAAGKVTGAHRATYKYLQIVAENITGAQIKNVIIRFTVENSWIAQNRIDIRTITLNHYNSATGKWTPLPTTFLSENNAYAYFSAVSPGLSVFEISGQPLQPDLTISVSPTSGEFVVGIIVVILIVIAVIAAIFLYRRKLLPESCTSVQTQI